MSRRVLCQKIGELIQPIVEIRTTSTLASWTPNSVINSGDALHWEVTGAVTTSYDGSIPTFNFSTAGTKNIIITSTDNLIGLTILNIPNKNINYLDISGAVNLQSIIFGTNQIPSLDLSNNNNLGNIDMVANSTLTSCLFGYNTNSINASFLNCSLTSLDISGLPNLVQLFLHNNDLDTLDISNNTILARLRVQGNSLSVSSINNILLDRYNNGVLSGSRDINYGSQSPAANPTATEYVANDVLDAYNALSAAGWSLTGSVPS